MSSDMDCNEAVEALHEFLRQECTPELAQQIKQHLEDCRPCLGHAQFEKSYLAMLESMAGTQGCPDSVRSQILDALRKAAEPPPSGD